MTETTMASVPIMIIFLFLSFKSKLSTANINMNSSLIATETENSKWTSPTEDFAFGFRRLTDSNHFLLAIWFNKIPDRTIVWHANGDNPAPSGSKVELTATSLALTDPEGQIIWEAKPDSTISSAEMLDSGNFVLSGGGSTYLWESFRNPTDTILPSQVLNLGEKLYSKLNETNYSRGRFLLQFADGSLSLHPTALPSDNAYKSYIDSNTSNPNPLESGYQLVFNRSGALYITRANGRVANIPNWNSMSYSEDFYYRATMEFDGVFIQYSYPRNSSSPSQEWRDIQHIPEDMCTVMFTDIGSGPCGFNSYCALEKSRPRCDCPPGYVFTSPTNRYGGCRTTYPQGCGLDDGLQKPEDLYEFEEYGNVDFPMNNYEMLPYNKTQCKDACLRDCDCAVAVLESNSKCWKKRLPLSMGRWTGNTGINFTMLFKVRKQVPPSVFTRSKGNKEKTILLGIVSGGSALIIVLLVIVLLYLLKKFQRQTQNNAQDPSSKEINLRLFNYKELEEATGGFREELGRGSFGIVYKGALRFGSRNAVAVKKLDKLAQDREKEFRTEMNAIGNTHHKNLVKLLGYCDEGSHRLLIYEFMSNRTLADLLFGLWRPDWEQRVKIALGIARGLLYLHEECDVPIIHCDIKPQNILLDDNLTPKISDFGLAKLLLSNQTRTRTMVRGTRGYVAPEWFKNVPITAKVDVYSFGVMLLEIICCRKGVVMEHEKEERAILTDWAYDCFLSGRLDLLVENDGVAMSDKTRLEKWVKIAIWCIQEDPSERPTMKMVMGMLEGFVDVPLPPTPSFASLSSQN